MREKEKLQNDDNFFSLLSYIPQESYNIRKDHQLSVFSNEKEFDDLLNIHPLKMNILNQLERSSAFIPDYPIDHVDYKPNNASNVPQLYPKFPKMKLLVPETMQLYDILTLFYIFFYFPGHSCQYFSYKELRFRGWRFCKKMNTWVHPISEPVSIKPDSIIGGFEIFNHSGNKWVIETKISIEIPISLEENQ